MKESDSDRKKVYVWEQVREVFVTEGKRVWEGVWYSVRDREYVWIRK